MPEKRITYYKYKLLESCDDFDVANFISPTFANISDSVEVDALCGLVKGKKANGSWPFDHAIYTYSPTSLEAARYNIRDPTKYKLNFVGDVSAAHSPLGLQGNGIWYARPGFIPSVVGMSNLPRWHYASNGIFEQLFGYDWGATTKGAGFFLRGAKFATGPNYQADYGIGKNAVVTTGAISGIYASQRYFAFKAGFPERHYFNGAMVLETGETVVYERNFELAIMAINNAGTFQNPSNSRQTYLSWGDQIGFGSETPTQIDARQLDEANIIAEYNATVIPGGR